MMLKFRRFTVMMLVGMLAAVGSADAQGGSSGAVMELTGKDYAEIEQLYGRYNQGSDFRDVDLWLSAFADDAVFVVGGTEYKGTEALREFRTSSFARSEGGPPRRHWSSSLVITPTADGAEGRAYYFVMDVSTRPPTIGGGGYQEDVFVKTADGWLIQSRTLAGP